MPALHAIAIDKLVRLIGTPNAPTIVDIRSDPEFASDPRFIPGSLRRPAETVTDWSAARIDVVPAGLADDSVLYGALALTGELGAK